MVVCWENNFTGYVVDYGTEPDQGVGYFQLRDANRTLQSVAAGAGLDGAIYAGLDRLTAALLTRDWRREDGAAMRVDRLLVDANWGATSNLVYQFCAQSKHAATITPSHGRYVGASTAPFSEYRAKRGDKVGLNWRVPLVAGRRTVRHVVFDTNFWKSFLHARLATAMGDAGCLSLWGDSAAAHRMVADHITAEYRVTTQGRGRTVDEWKMRAERSDNHYLDCAAGCAVGASMCGVDLLKRAVPLARRRQSFRDYVAARAAR